MSPSSRTHHLSLLTLLLLLLLLLTHPSTSDATGTYIHRSCLTNTDISDGPTGWQPFSYAVPGSQTSILCPSDGLHAALSITGQLPPGQGAGWTYYAPSGTSITRTNFTIAGWTKGWNGNQGLIQFLDATGVLSELNGTIDSEQEDAFDWDGLETPRVTVRAICDYVGTSCTNAVAWMSIYQSEIYLADDVAPTIGSVSGSLKTDQPLVGEERLNFTAADAGSGIAKVRLYVDGRLTSVIDDGDRCAPSDVKDGVWVYSLPRPCSTSINTLAVVDTTKIADGRRTLTVKVVDAAQQETTVWSAERVVANHSPVNQRLPSFADDAVYVDPVVGAAIEATSDGLWSVPGTSLLRSWTRCDAQGFESSCVSIPGATGLRYTPSTDDIGHRLRLLLTASNAAGITKVSTAPSGVVVASRSGGGSTPDPTTDPDPDPDPGVDPGTTPDPAPGSGGGVPVGPVGGGNVVVAPAPVVAPVGAVPVATGHALVGRVVGEASGVGCPQDRATLRFERVVGGVVKLGYGKAATARLQLMCTNNGKPIEGARLDVVTRVGTRPAVTSDVVTDGSGHAPLRLAAGPGRAVTIGYRMYADDPFARATATLKVSVNGRISLRGSHRKVRNGRAVRLRGRLLGGYVPRRGVTLNVQWKDRSRWRPFAQIKTNKKGTFSYAYRFTRTTRPVTYTLRVQATKGQLDYPFQPVASNPVKVTVMP
jgi:hypothetical protein